MSADTTASRVTTRGRRRRPTDAASREERTFAYLFVLPAVALVLVFRIVPLFWGLVLSLTNPNGLSLADFVGFANYVAVARDPAFRDFVANALILIATLPVWVLLPLLKG